METYFSAIKNIKDIQNFELFNILNACGENVIVFAPSSDVSFKDYQNIFVLDNYLCRGYVSSLCTKFNKVYCVNSKLNMNLFSNLDPARESFAKMMNSVKANKSPAASYDLINYFNNLKRYNMIDRNTKYNQFVFFVIVMKELGIAKFEDGQIVLTDVKSKLENSSIYDFVTKLLNLK